VNYKYQGWPVELTIELVTFISNLLWTYGVYIKMDS